jgi:hypothetical protein
MRIYIAGGMRKHEFYNFPSFDEAEQHLKDLGYEVVSPARLDMDAGFSPYQLPDDHDWSEMPPGMDYEETMARDLAALDKCDAIYMLRGWTTSTGARREQIHAAATGRHVFYEQDVLEPPSLIEPDDSTCKESLHVQGSPLPTDKQARKETPIASGVLDYFPDAIAALAHCSWVGNEQHQPGEPLRWAREKSSDHADCLMRHFMERGTVDSDGVRHSIKVLWRAAALAQLEIEGAR